MGRETLVPQSFQVRLAYALLGFSAYHAGAKDFATPGAAQDDLTVFY